METRGAKRLHAYFTSDAQSDTGWLNLDSFSCILRRKRVHLHYAPFCMKPRTLLLLF